MKVFFFTSAETLNVLAATAPYYTLRFLEQRADAQVFLEHTAGMTGTPRPHDVVYHRSKLLPGLAHVNLPAAWTLLRHGLDRNALVYTYNRLVGPGLLARLRGRAWVVDFQTPPLEQDRKRQVWAV